MGLIGRSTGDRTRRRHGHDQGRTHRKQPPVAALVVQPQRGCGRPPVRAPDRRLGRGGDGRHAARHRRAGRGLARRHAAGPAAGRGRGHRLPRLGERNRDRLGDRRPGGFARPRPARRSQLRAFALRAGPSGRGAGAMPARHAPGTRRADGCLAADAVGPAADHAGGDPARFRRRSGCDARRGRPVGPAAPLPPARRDELPLALAGRPLRRGTGHHHRPAARAVHVGHRQVAEGADLGAARQRGSAAGSGAPR